MNYYWDGLKVLVTGGSGFLGSHLVNKLIGFGSSVSVADINPPDYRYSKFSREDVDYYQIDIMSNDLDICLQNHSFDYIFHLAGNASVQLSVKQPFNDFEANLRGTLLLLETMRTMNHPPKLVYVSSAAVYGNPVSIPISEDDITVPISPYGISKLAAERYLYVYVNIHGLKAVSARPFSVFGPGQRKLVVYDIIRKISTNTSRLELYGSGGEARDFIYVSDLVDALLMLAERSRMSGEIYNVATGVSTDIALIARELCNIMNVSPEITYKGVVRPGVPLIWQANVSRLSSFGFKPQVSLNEGLRRTVDWFNLTADHT